MQGLDWLIDGFMLFLLSFHVVGSSECLRGMLDKRIFVFKVQKTMPTAV